MFVSELPTQLDPFNRDNIFRKSMKQKDTDPVDNSKSHAHLYTHSRTHSTHLYTHSRTHTLTHIHTAHTHGHTHTAHTHTYTHTHSPPVEYRKDLPSSKLNTTQEIIYPHICCSNTPIISERKLNRAASHESLNQRDRLPSLSGLNPIKRGLSTESIFSGPKDRSPDPIYAVVEPRYDRFWNIKYKFRIWLP